MIGRWLYIVQLSMSISRAHYAFMDSTPSKNEHFNNSVVVKIGAYYSIR